MDIVQQIRARGLKATPSRLEVINAIGSLPLAYSHAELELLFNAMDRVTLYRVLKDFEDAGLVHKIIDFEGVTRFALCRHSCPSEHHEDNHVHFNCKSCHKMYCLEKVESPDISVPDGFRTTGSQMLVYGFCDSCNNA